MIAHLSLFCLEVQAFLKRLCFLLKAAVICLWACFICCFDWLDFSLQQCTWITSLALILIHPFDNINNKEVSLIRGEDQGGLRSWSKWDRIEHESGLPDGKWKDEERGVAGGAWNRGGGWNWGAECYCETSGFVGIHKRSHLPSNILAFS